MPVKTKEMRRLYEAAVKDKTPQRFFEDVREGLAEKHLRPDDFSIQEMFGEFVEDGHEIIRSWKPSNGGQGGVNLREAEVNTAAFSNITEIVFSAQVMEAFMSEEFVFSRIIPTQQTNFNGEKIRGITQLGDSGSIVGESQPYPTVGVGEDWIETPQTTKRGLIVPVTKEAVFFDQTGILLQRCGEVGYSLGLGKEKRAIDCFIDENSTVHRYKWRGTVYATYQTTTPWDNITASNALVDWTDLDAAEQTFNALVDPWTGEPIMVDPTHLVVTKQLEQTANRILNSTEIRTATPGVSGAPIEGSQANPYKGKYQLLTSRLLASRMATDTTWYLGNPAKQAKYMENWGIQTVKAPVNSTAEFERDIVEQFKASERGAYATVQPRATVKSTA